MKKFIIVFISILITLSSISAFDFNSNDVFNFPSNNIENLDNLFISNPLSEQTLLYNSSSGLWYNSYVNYSETSSNNSQFLRGYSPTSLRSWMQSFFNGLYCELIGCIMTGDINMVDNNLYANYIYAEVGNFTDLYVSNNSIYIGDSIKLSANEGSSSTLNISGGNVSVGSSGYYFGSGQYLTDLNLTGISFQGDTINATTFNGDYFNGGVFNSNDWSNVSISASQVSDFTESVQDISTITVKHESTILTTSGGSGTATSGNVDFVIKQINVIPNNLSTSFRFQAVDSVSGEIIDSDIIEHDSYWAIKKDYPINSAVNFTISSASQDDTFNITIKYLDNLQ